MNNYERVLPELFPYVTECTHEQLRYLVLELTSSERTDVSAGSSFAVVSGIDHPEAKQRLWLSGVSWRYLKKRHAQIRGNVPCMNDWELPNAWDYGQSGK